MSVLCHSLLSMNPGFLTQEPQKESDLAYLGVLLLFHRALLLNPELSLQFPPYLQSHIDFAQTKVIKVLGRKASLLLGSSVHPSLSCKMIENMQDSEFTTLNEFTERAISCCSNCSGLDHTLKVCIIELRESLNDEKKSYREITT